MLKKNVYENMFFNFYGSTELDLEPIKFCSFSKVCDRTKDNLNDVKN